jgi:hypothetical protein
MQSTTAEEKGIVPQQQLVANREEIIEVIRNDMDAFGATAAPEDCSYAFPELYKQMWHMLLPVLQLTRDFGKYAIGLPRGHAKTFVLKLLILWIILFTQKRFILVICASEGLAKNIVADIADMLDSPNIQALFGNWRFGITIDRQEKKKFAFRGRDIILAGVGQQTAIRGIQEKNVRPDFILFDDAQTRECAKSAAEAQAFHGWMNGTAMKAKSPAGCTFVYVGNMYPDLIIKEATPERQALYACQLRNLQFSRFWTSFIVGGILADGKALWEELQPLSQLLEEYETDKEAGTPEVFYAEVMNDPQANGLQNLDVGKMQVHRKSHHELHLGNFVIIDPSGSKKRSDNTSMGLHEVYEDERGVPFTVLRELRNEIMDPLKTIQTAVQMCIDYGCNLIAVEDVAYQSTLLFWFAQVCEWGNLRHIELVAVNPKGRAKNRRIIDSFRRIEAGRHRFDPNTYSSYTAQVSKFDRLKTTNADDILDNVAYADDVIQDYSGFLLAEAMPLNNTIASPYAGSLDQLRGPDYYK